MIPLPHNFATVKNPKTGVVKIGKVGFSFTALIFHILTPLFRSDWYNVLCIIGVDCIATMMISLITHQPLNDVAQISNVCTSILWGFIYNMMYFRHLSHKGFVPVDEHSRQLLRKNKYIK